MINFRPPDTRTRPSNGSNSSVTAEKALSFISKGWQEVRSSADADLQLIKNRANSFKNLADREFENFLNSASISSPFVVPVITSSATTMTPVKEIDFVKKLKPKLSEIRRVYSSPEFKWPTQGKLKIDLSAIKNAIVSEVEEEERWRKWRRERLKEEGQFGEFNWEPIKAFKTRLRELEVELTGSSSSAADIIEGIKNSEFVVKVKSSLKSICKEPEETKGVPPLDVPELLAYLVRQSSPFLDQIGIKRDISEKIVESLYSKGQSKLLLHSLPGGESSLIDGEIMNDELDLRIASVLQSTGHCYEGGFWGDAKQNPAGDKRHVAIITTASLPWMTGTAVNPLFRAAYLAKSEKQNVTLLVPWLCKSDQELVYPNQLTFSSPEDQELYIRNWLEERIGFKANFKISFYPGKFAKERRSILPAGDTSQFIPSRDADIAILEEPEHLNWYHHGKRWTDKFNHVVGIVHTNYLEYIKREKNGALQAFFVKHINNWVTRAYCDKVLRLSAATQDLPKSLVCNVHGVNPKFLKIGKKAAADRQSGEKVFSKGAYFLGKMVWAKGYRELIDLLSKHKTDLDGFNLDVFGNGEDAHEVESTAKRLNLNVNFMKGRDHADDSLHGYKVFINPSISDVLCTATAEALAMGKFVVCADHPSNEFFQAFPNCFTYKTPEDFVAKVEEAMSSEPHPLTPEEQYKLSWEAATQRFMEYSDLDKVLSSETSLDRRRRKGMGKSVSMPNLEQMVDGGLAFAHYCLTGNEFLRLCTGAIPRTRDYDQQHCNDLRLLPPQVENPIYGW
ncbi:digalactosyldiacylglycerol synthase 1, chloroplastic-like [Lycium ferocissimum]|uniref:digalactosyldiacylglycerol synthase 1, chloroplastic-like n=1 Tax=Lycium ferocissimum TaxID=112874 RepID=UPI002815AE01|nr:digalactosyldiacylglycerol synthase 1, chloroplastic-like [Lycium ferocissimum]